MYAQSIEKSNLRRMSSKLKRSVDSDKCNLGSKRGCKLKIYLVFLRRNLIKGGGSRNGKPTCSTCGNKNLGECLLGMGIFFGYGRYGHKVRDCPSISSRKEGKKVEPSGPKEDAPTKRRFFALRTTGKKLVESDDDVSKFSLFC